MVLQMLYAKIYDTVYNHLTKDLKVKPEKITKETIFEKLNLFSDNENMKCKYLQLSNSRKTTLINITNK